MPKIQLIRVAYAESWTAGKLYVIYEIIYCEWLKFTYEILIYVNLYLSQQQILSHLFVNKGSPVSAVLYTPYTDQFIYIQNTWDITCRHPSMILAHFSI